MHKADFIFEWIKRVVKTKLRIYSSFSKPFPYLTFTPGLSRRAILKTLASG